MGEFSLTHWLVIAVIGIVFFGPKRLPQLGSSLGESIRGFKKALNDHHDTQENKASVQDQAQQPAQHQQQHQAPDAVPGSTNVKDSSHS